MSPQPATTIGRESLDELGGSLAGTVIGPETRGGILVESLHGAPKDGDADGPIRFRGAAFNVSATATWQDPAHDESSIEWARDTTEALERWSFGGGYANYMQADEPLERVRAALGGEAFERLQALKRRYDPTNVLRRNQNIPPAG
jgi:FAD/FMN-containing dehydrogenase